MLMQHAFGKGKLHAWPSALRYATYVGIVLARCASRRHRSGAEHGFCAALIFSKGNHLLARLAHVVAAFAAQRNFRSLQCPILVLVSRDNFERHPYSWLW